MNKKISGHPNPIFEREGWESLNGEWEFEFDFGDSGIEREVYKKEHLDRTIVVPFCPESSLSGVGYKDFMNAVWYKRKINISAEQLKNRLVIHFGAVDYECRVYVNGSEAGHHKGGYSSFEIDITKYLHEGGNDISVYARDDNRSGLQPRGKQSEEYYSHGCDYTRTTGIWQTVWIEETPSQYIKSVKYYPDIANGTVTIAAEVEGSGRLEAHCAYEGRKCGDASADVHGGSVMLSLKPSELHLWQLGEGNIYSLELRFNDDIVKSYFGMRQVGLSGRKFILNGETVFQRTVLDQGFYKEGIYTARDDAELLRDIELSMSVGFNGARLHQKIFDPRFLYFCDLKGYMVWGEHGNWGIDLSRPEALHSFLPEWMEAVDRDFNHPSIIGWCPFNETWDYKGRRQFDDTLRVVYNVTKSMDTTRPCIDTSGNYHVKTDIFDLHNYEQDPDVFRDFYKDIAQTGSFFDSHDSRQKPDEDSCQPIFISEYGGIKWDTDADHNDVERIEQGEKAATWGYGEPPHTKAEFMDRYRRLTDSLLDNPEIMGFCYTQLYDVEQEVNGLFTYERAPKFDTEELHRINSRRAAIEK